MDRRGSVFVKIYRNLLRTIIFIAVNIVAMLVYTTSFVNYSNITTLYIVNIIVAIVAQFIILYLCSGSIMISLTYVILFLYLCSPSSLYLITSIILPLVITVILNKNIISKDSLIISIHKLVTSKPKIIKLNKIRTLHIVAEYLAYVTIIMIIIYSTMLSGLTPYIFNSIYSIFIPVSILLGLLMTALFGIKPFFAGLLGAFSLYSIGALPRLIVTSTIEMPEEKIVRGIHLGDIIAKLEYGYPSNPYFKMDASYKLVKTWYWKRVQNKKLVIDIHSLPNQHTVIVGASGMGKSFLAKHMVKQMINKYGYTAIIFDFHNEYKDLVEFEDVIYVDAKNVAINPFKLARLSPREQAHHISQLIASVFNLGNIQQLILEDIIVKAYEYKGIYEDRPDTWHNKPPTFSDLINTAQALSEEIDTKRVIPYLRSIDAIFQKTFELDIDDIIQRSTVIDLSKLPSEFARILYIYTVLQNILDHLYITRSTKRIAIVIDEAHRIFSKKFSRAIISRYLMESRKYGVAIIIITQQPMDITPQIYQNTTIKISFRINEPKNIDYISKILCGTYDQAQVKTLKYALNSLNKGEYILRIETLNNHIYLCRI